MKKAKKFLVGILLASMLMTNQMTFTFATAQDPAATTDVIETPIQTQEEEQQTTTEESTKQPTEAPTETPAKTDNQDKVTEDAAEEAEPDSPVLEVGVNIENTDINAGTFDARVVGLEEFDSVTRVQLPVWCSDDQSDLKWYEAKKQSDGTYLVTVDVANHKYHQGTYKMDIYATEDDIVYGFHGTSWDMRTLSDALVVTNADGKETEFEIQLKNLQVPGAAKTVMLAVWSTANGQDDLHWYTAQKVSNSEYTYSVKISDHKSLGEYNVHAYVTSKGNEQRFLTSTTFSVTAPTVGSIEVTDTNLTKGTFTVTVKGAESPAGIAQVMIPVWSKDDQSDLHWYKASKTSDGDYQVTVKIADHNYNTGTYIADVYVTDGNGIQKGMGRVTCDITITGEKPEVTAVLDKTGTKAEISMDDVIIPGGVKNVLFAVWSEAGGQDDLKWNTAKYNEDTQKWEFEANLSDYESAGTYQVHAYARNNSDSMIYINRTTFEVEAPSAKNIEVLDADTEKGTFTVSVTDVTASAGIDQVLVPIWCASNQSDIKWYVAEKQKDGSYQVKADIANHKYNLGTYQIHVYVKEKNGFQTILGKTTCEMPIPKVELNVTDTDGTQTTFLAKMTNVIVPGGEKEVDFAVWSKTGGQDDLRWYTAKKTEAGVYTAEIPIINHKTLGEYNVAAYVKTQGDVMVGLTNAQFTVSSSATATVTASEAADKGSFKVTVADIAASVAVSKVEVAVWSTSDQSDLAWYAASAQDDGTYAVTVKLSNHKYNLGTYNAHVYITMKNGIQNFVGKTQYEYNPSNYIYSEHVGRGLWRVTVKNPSASQTVTSVQVPVWSTTNGQDDLVWYTASQNDDGSWSAVVDAKNHKHAGEYQAGVYANGSIGLGSVTFTVPESEMIKNGWYYEDGYKFYYINDVKQTDLDGILPIQSSYVAKVNRVTCTVTIYASDGGNGYIIPVKVFACSVGMPDTPTPLGTYNTLAKYRWHELMGPSYGQYCTRIVDGILFHSVAGSNMTSHNLSAVEYNKLGSPASHGCVRLCVRDAKWIYDNCSLGMSTTIYDSSDPGPFGKPATIKIPEGQDWDPTDPNV